MDYNKKLTLHGKPRTINQWLEYLLKLTTVKYDTNGHHIPHRIKATDPGFFACPEAYVFLKTAIENTRLDHHEPYNSGGYTYDGHDPEISKNDLRTAFEAVAQEVKKEIEKTPMAQFSHEPNKIIYGDATHQIIYSWDNNDKKWDISTKGEPNATIIDSDGAILEISKGHIHISAIEGYQGNLKSTIGHSPSAHAAGVDSKSKQIVPNPVEKAKGL